MSPHRSCRSRIFRFLFAVREERISALFDSLFDPFMKELRLGIIGLGNMGSAHAASILAGNIPRCRLAGVCDLDPEKVAKYPGVFGCTDSDALIASGEVDAVMVATPHYGHTTIGVAALQTAELHPDADLGCLFRTFIEAGVFAAHP